MRLFLITTAVTILALPALAQDIEQGLADLEPQFEAFIACNTTETQDRRYGSPDPCTFLDAYQEAEWEAMLEAQAQAERLRYLEAQILIQEAENRLAASVAAGEEAAAEATNTVAALRAAGRLAEVTAINAEMALAREDRLAAEQSANAVALEAGRLVEPAEVGEQLPVLAEVIAELDTINRSYDRLVAEAVESCLRNEAAGSPLDVCDRPGHELALEASLAE